MSRTGRSDLRERVVNDAFVRTPAEVRDIRERGAVSLRSCDRRSASATSPTSRTRKSTWLLFIAASGHRLGKYPPQMIGAARLNLANRSGDLERGAYLRPTA